MLNKTQHYEQDFPDIFLWGTRRNRTTRKQKWLVLIIFCHKSHTTYVIRYESNQFQRNLHTSRGLIRPSRGTSCVSIPLLLHDTHMVALWVHGLAGNFVAPLLRIIRSFDLNNECSNNSIPLWRRNSTIYDSQKRF